MRALVVGALALLVWSLSGCADDAADEGTDVEPCPAEFERLADGACTPVARCEDGIDLTGDGVCDLLPDGCPEGGDANGDGICDRLVADWSRDAVIPEGGHRADIYLLGDALPEVATRGIGHSLVWPVEISGVLLPWRPIRTMFDPDADDRATLAVQALSRGQLGFGNLDEMYAWLGLARATGEPIAYGEVAWPAYVEEGAPLGAGVIDTAWGEALTFSCATCHTAQLFGRTVVGATNRNAQANEYFYEASTFFPDLPPNVFANATGANELEMELFLRTQSNFAVVGTLPPQVRGLDTSLAQVALSLARRELDAWATRNPELEATPRPNLLEHYVADSKPAVWWTLRYKTRWLSDGSIVSGNPIFTNFLWNEIGRGTDLNELETWLRDNQEIVDELTVAAFATEPPLWSDFFGTASIDIDAARRGQVHFEAMCASCHGTYEKTWDLPHADSLSLAEQLRTSRVVYHRQTPVMNVGTDPQRAVGMEAFADELNALAISAWMETVVEVQDGYVPPPLDGIWARYPYLHNQSVPTLCDLLLPASMRTSSFWMGPSDDAETDFDFDCVGYPTGDHVPSSWMDDPRAHFDTTRPGLSNGGHDAWLTTSDGTPVLSDAERRDLIHFLKTL